MHLPILTPDQAPAASRPILGGIDRDLGFVPNLVGAIAASPMLLAGFDGLRRAVGTDSFNPIHREIAGVAVGVAVDNAYGVAFHSTVLGRLGVDEEAIEAMRHGAEPADPTHAAVYAFATAVTNDRGAVDEAVLQRAADAGLSESDLLDLVTECVFASLVGIVDNLAGRVELDLVLQPRSWK